MPSPPLVRARVQMESRARRAKAERASRAKAKARVKSRRDHPTLPPEKARLSGNKPPLLTAD